MAGSRPPQRKQSSPGPRRSGAGRGLKGTSQRDAQPLGSAPPHTWDAVMKAARQLFPTGNRFGVLAYGIGRRRVKGEPGEETTLTVYVRRKQERPEHPVPDLVFRDRRRWNCLAPDVVAVGALPTASYSTIPEFEGLRIGATVNAVAPSGVLWAGGVTALLTSAGSHEPRWLLTAGHLFERGAWQTRVFAALPGDKPRVVGHPVVNLLEAPASSLPFDAALVELTDEGRQLARKTAQLRTAGVALEGWTGAPVRMLRPTTNAWASSRSEACLFDVHFPGSAFGPISLRGLIATETPISIEGDSGAALLTPGESRQVLGSCCGALPAAHSFFQPLAPAIQRLEQRLGVRLHLWEKPA